ncbi:MAG: hypothetical protein V8R70_03780 [Candidatus Gastranaerophilaceae bacterium]
MKKYRQPHTDDGHQKLQSALHHSLLKTDRTAPADQLQKAQ